MFTINEEDDLKLAKAVIETLKSTTPLQTVENLKCIEKKIAQKKVFNYLTLTYKKFMSQEMLTKWKKKYEEDKRILYSDQQITAKDNSSSLITARSDTSVTNHETGMITTDDKTTGWGQPSGILDFEPKDSKGNINKAIQICGNLPNI